MIKVTNTDKYKIISIFGIKINIKKEKTDIDNIISYIPFKKLRNSIKNIYFEFKQLDKKVDDLLRLNMLISMAQNIHPNTFGKFKNINCGKEVVLVATGPTLNKYKPIKNAIHVGVNSAIYYDKVDLDYYFLQDYREKSIAIPKYIIENQKDTCTYFFGGYDYSQFQTIVPESDLLLIKNAYRYIVDFESTYRYFIYDLLSLPLADFRSIVFEALQFIFWTNPKKIYLVGCDANISGYFNSSDNKNTLYLNDVMIGWNKLKQFRDIYYPDTEIISINPIGLKGLFSDIYTE